MELNTELIAELVESPFDNKTENGWYGKFVEMTNDVQLLPRCPHCGESYYMENYNSTTCVYYPSIYKDGVNINPDRNKTITHCTCMSCGKDFIL